MHDYKPKMPAEEEYDRLRLTAPFVRRPIVILAKNWLGALNDREMQVGVVNSIVNKLVAIVERYGIDADEHFVRGRPWTGLSVSLNFCNPKPLNSQAFTRSFIVRMFYCSIILE